MSWLSDLAGKAESILNKIDQNAANVLKNENEQLLEVQSNGDVENAVSSSSSSSIRRTTSVNALKLTRTPKKIANKDPEMDVVRSEKSLLNVSEIEEAPQLAPSLSNASNSSRRSSWSSRTEGITVIEYPLAGPAVPGTGAPSATAADMQSSVHSTISNQSADSERTELAAVKIVMAQLKAERDQIGAELDRMARKAAMDHSSELIADLERTCNELTAEKEQMAEKLEQLLATNNAYVKSISELETTLAKLHQSESEAIDKMNMARAEREHAILELQQYRSRAQHTLQLKDQLIEGLKGGTRSEATPASTPSDQSPLRDSGDVQLLQAERDQLLAEAQTLRSQIEAGNQYVRSLESRIYDIEQRSNERELFLNNALQQEKLRCVRLEEQRQIRMQELEACRDQLERQHANFSLRERESDAEMAKLKTKITQLNWAGPSSTAFDERINSLTQSLVQKQNSLESVTVERNAIRIQLEKLELQYRKTLALLNQQQPTRIINVNDTDDAKSQVPNFMLENPFDTRVARRVKRAYSTLDSMGIRLGIFLRRYPLIRVFVIVYVAVLHLWVMVVLLSSTPS